MRTLLAVSVALLLVSPTNAADPPRAAVKGGFRTRIAIVDDVMSAGSAARGTYSELRIQEAVPVVVGALLVLGSTGADFFLQNGVAVEAVARRPYRLWRPAACPLCASGVSLEAVSQPAAV